MLRTRALLRQRSWLRGCLMTGLTDNHLSSAATSHGARLSRISLRLLCSYTSRLSPSVPMTRDTGLGVYADQMYELWLNDRSSVHSSWNEYFNGKANELLDTTAQPRSTSAMAQISDHLKVQLLVKSYQTRGHNVADLDPLGISPKVTPREFDPAFYGLTERDMDREFVLPVSTSIGGNEESLPLREIIARLKKVYCGHTGVEYMHLTDYKQQRWIQRRFEWPSTVTLNEQHKRNIFKQLMRSTKFEEFLATKYPGEKRFGSEGCEVLVPAIKQIIDTSSAGGVDSVIIGMPHRGRLNILANICHQNLPTLFSQFCALEPRDEGSGDVKYHLGVCVNRYNMESQRSIKISVVANPSHLEAVDPVVLGKARAEMTYGKDPEADRTLAILMHGDAAICGEGIVMETFNLNNLKEYSVHGCIHVVVNNQIGFTTDPRSSRSTPYCTDFGLGCPIFHVNSDDPEAVYHACTTAADWRRAFKKDVIVDLVCYRRHGHNELDEPMFTQPLMYQRVAQIKPVLEIYTKQLLDEHVIESRSLNKYMQNEVASYTKLLEEAYQEAQKMTCRLNSAWIDSPWDESFMKQDPLNMKPTAVTKENIDLIMDKFSSMPKDFNSHKGVDRIMGARKKMHADGSYDWACGEALAFGSLLVEGTHVRLSGEDVERGTFSHRHHVLHDQVVDQKTYTALEHLSANQARYTICNSSISEYGILGFEVGYSLVDPNSLVIWEAQFGDFANNAQCIIDSIICSGQAKWTRQTGVVVSLPHGHEGMGPEHSSARVERYLQLCNEDDQFNVQRNVLDTDFATKQLHETNWIVTNCTTPANLFHVYRRQVAMPFRRPLMQFSPKSLLRHPLVRSPLKDFLPGTSFMRLIPEDGPASNSPDSVTRLIFCSGKVYYDLVSVRKHLQAESKVAICRVEQLSPLPYDLIAEQCQRYKNCDLIWSQEEHKNAGAWSFIRPRINSFLAKENRKIKYVGRPPSASPATGNKFTHLAELRSMLSKSMDVSASDLGTFKP